MISANSAMQTSSIEITAMLPSTGLFTSSSEFNDYCRQVANSNPEVPSPGDKFRENISAIRASEIDKNKIIVTNWGGVVITFREDPKVEKFLVVEAGKWLAFEKHEKKVETLEVQEGLGLLIYRPQGESKLATLELTPGTSITLQPGQEHCIIAINDLVVFEKSMDYKGMDQDLIFIHMPSY